MKSTESVKNSSRNAEAALCWPGPTGACDDFLPINSFDKKKGVGKECFKFMMPKVVYALFATHYRRHMGLALSKLDELLSEHGQRSGLIFDDEEPHSIGHQFWFPRQTTHKGPEGSVSRD